MALLSSRSSAEEHKRRKTIEKALDLNAQGGRANIEMYQLPENRGLYVDQLVQSIR